MTITSLDTFYAKGDPKIVGWTFQGTAEVKPAGDRSSTQSVRTDNR